MQRNSKIILIFLFYFSALASQKIDTIEVEITSDIVQYENIRCIYNNNKLYFAIDDLAEKLSFPLYRNFVLKKMELNMGDYLLKLSSNNHFVTFTDQTNYKRWIEQNINPMLLIDSIIFAPSDFVVDKFRKYCNVTIKYEATSTPSIESDISTYTFKESETSLQLYFPINVPPKNWNLKQENKNSVSIQLINCRVDEEKIQNAKIPELILAPFVQQEDETATITFVMRQKFKPDEVILQFDEKSNSILVEFTRKNIENINPTSEVKSIPITKSQSPKIEESEKKRWEFDVVVIDPGHGGKDPGSIGVTGVLEKNITLGVALKLGELIESNLKGVKVVYTRKNDSFVELYRRGKLANDSEGKLFISIHCNSFDSDNQSPKGFEIYLLRPGKNDQAVKIASRENDVIKFEEDYQSRYKEITEDNFILLTMAQSAFVKQSEEYAEILQSEMDKKLVSESRGVKQAGFQVLVGASMPNVLIETGYLSNKQEEQFLLSERGQQLIAESIFSAIKKYKDYYEKNILNEG